MSSLEDRLRQALSSDFRVERELARGGSAVVFLATDPALDRAVAVKVLRPELATARGSERFLREARLLAYVAHPNVVPIHRAGEADGLFYYVMDHLEGETLRDRLARGPLEPGPCLGMARDLLAALGAAHEAGVVHRDVKPENILLRGDRALLTDFGIAREAGVGPDPDAGAGAGALGTPGYMAPEQAEGGEATPATDLYATGMLIYVALTGRRWRLASAPGDADWSGVPPRLVPVLQRALAPDPAARWPDAAAFREALSEAGDGRGPRLRWRIAAGAALLLAASAVLIRVAGRSGDEVGEGVVDLAVLPCEAADQRDSTLAQSVARIAALDLAGFAGLKVRRPLTSFRWWNRPGAGRLAEDAPSALHARHATSCVLARPRPDTLEARLELVDARGGRLPVPRPVRGPATDPPQALGDSVALALLQRLGRTLSSGGISVLGGLHVQAVSAFLRGEAAFEAGDWPRADSAYSAALGTEPGFALALWRLADVRRWELKTSVDLGPLLETHGAGLGPLDRRLLEVRGAPPGPDQFALYRAILRDYPHDPYATFLFADELFHRGPLWGIPLDSADHVLELAVSRDSFFQPALEHLVEARIRLGERESAAETLRRLEALAAASRRGPSPITRAIAEAWRERFASDSVEAGRRALFGERPDPGSVLFWVRLSGPTLDLDRTEREMGEALVAIAGPRARARLSGHVAQGLALMAGGRPAAALAQMDSAASLSDDDRFVVESAVWRVVPAALRVPGIPGAEVDAGRARLRDLAAPGASDPEARREAAWSLALDAYRRGDLPGGDRWAGVVGGASPDSVGGRLRTLLDALRLGALGEPGRALETSRSLLAYDSASALEAPFSRAALHLLRAEWQADAGRPADALTSLTWQENSDLESSPGPSPYPGPHMQAGEVDWALGTEGRLRGAEAALRADRRPRACRWAREALRLWDDTDPALAPSVARARDVEARACPR